MKIPYYRVVRMLGAQAFRSEPTIYFSDANHNAIRACAEGFERAFVYVWTSGTAEPTYAGMLVAEYATDRETSVSHLGTLGQP